MKIGEKQRTMLVQTQYSACCQPGGVLNFELGTDMQPEVSTTAL